MRRILTAALLATTTLAAGAVAATAAPGDMTMVALGDPRGDVAGTSGAAQKAQVDISQVQYSLTHAVQPGGKSVAWNATFRYRLPLTGVDQRGVTYVATTIFKIGDRTLKTVATTGASVKLYELVGKNWEYRPLALLGGLSSANGELSFTMRAPAQESGPAYSQIRSVVYRHSVAPNGKRTSAYDHAPRLATLTMTP